MRPFFYVHIIKGNHRIACYSYQNLTMRGDRKIWWIIAGILVAVAIVAFSWVQIESEVSAHLDALLAPKG